MYKKRFLELAWVAEADAQGAQSRTHFLEH